MKEGAVSRQLIGYNGPHRLEKFSNIVQRPTTHSEPSSEFVPVSLTSITKTKENVLQGQTTQKTEAGHKIHQEERVGGIGYDRYDTNIAAYPYIIASSERYSITYKDIFLFRINFTVSKNITKLSFFGLFSLFSSVPAGS